MKKIALIGFLALTSLGLFAQSTEDTQKFRLGLSFAPVASWFTTTGDGGIIEPNGLRYNIAFGLHTDFRIGNNSNYFFSTGLFLLNTGGTLDHDYYTENDNGTYSLTERTVDFRINYVNIPLTVMLRTNQIGYMHYFAKVGFDGGVNIKTTFDSEDRRVSNPDAASLTIEDADGSDFTRLFRLGLHIELGFEYDLAGNTRLFVGAEYNQGLNNVFDDDYRIPVGTTMAPDSDILLIDPETSLPFVDEKVEASTSFIAIKVGAYF